jgi:hypothetical protein
VVRVVGAETGDERGVVRGEGIAADVAFSPDGRLLAASWPADHGGVVRIIDTADGSVRRELSWPGALRVAFSLRGRRWPWSRRRRGPSSTWPLVDSWRRWRMSSAYCTPWPGAPTGR